MRIFALSDVHVDYMDNLRHLDALSPGEFCQDALIVAGDVSDDLDKLAKFLQQMRSKFRWVFFVPGNHELWLRRGEARDSLEKFEQIRALCASLDVRTEPTRITGHCSVWVVPLFSWYMKPEQGPTSLFVEKKSGHDAGLTMWADDYFTKWDGLGPGGSVADFFIDMNEQHVGGEYDAPIVSFSHFLPRRELMFPNGEPPKRPPAPRVRGRGSQFNFSRVAGCTRLDEQIRALDSAVHVYGHQHRNRDCVIEGVRYVSNCLGYPHERARGETGGIPFPKLVWNTQAA